MVDVRGISPLAMQPLNNVDVVRAAGLQAHALFQHFTHYIAELVAFGAVEILVRTVVVVLLECLGEMAFGLLRSSRRSSAST
jgi:hypothetical protein